MPTMVNTLTKCGDNPTATTFWPEAFGLDQKLNHKRNAARVDVIHLGEIEHDQLGCVFWQRLVSAQHRIFRRAGDITLEAQNRYSISGRGC